MNGVWLLVVNVLWLVLVVGLVVIVARRRSRAMVSAAQSAGLTDIQTKFLGRVVGLWNGYPVSWNIIGGGKGGPERAIVDIAAAAPARLIVQKRFRVDIRFSLFGPPVVATPLDTEFVVRSDEVMVSQRLLADAKITEALRATLIERVDQLEMKPGRVRVTRAVRPIGREQALTAAWKLASTVVERL